MRTGSRLDDLRRLSRVALRRPFLGRARRRPRTLVLGLLAIVAWQWTFAANRDQLDGSFGLRASQGLNHERSFVYFLYYLGLFPVVSIGGHKPFLGEPGYKKFSREAAERVIAERGRTLRMERRNTIRVGEPGKVFLHLPYALWKGSARNPSMRPFHSVVFTFALGALFASFWWARLPLLGAILTAVVGSDPFQIFEVHARENVFGWPINAALLVLALNLPLLRSRGRPGLRPLWAIPVLTGALVATVGQIRSEPAAVMVVAALACLLTPRASRWTRLGLLGMLVVSFVGVTAAWQAWLDHKYAEARRVVSAAGGTPETQPPARRHLFWHPIWCGLGDFDTRYGHRWSDNAAYEFAYPILLSRYGIRHLKRGKPWPPEYERVLRDDLLAKVLRDPLWYGGILARRVWRLLEETTPVRLALGQSHVTLPLHGALFIPLVALFALAADGMLVRLACFPLATSLPALLVFSGAGMSYYSWYHLMGVALAASLAAQVGVSWLRRLRRRA